MKKIYLMLCTAFFLTGSVLGQANAANYGFVTSLTGSLTDMSSGTTQLIAPDQDDVASPVTNIGFDFFFQGVRYSQFSVNSNGSLRLGPAAASATGYDPLAVAGSALITAYGTDQRTHAVDGKVHYKIIGTAPNRILVVEWLNMQADYNAGGTADCSYQVKLSEAGDVIEFTYGVMKMSTAGAADVNSLSPQIGFSSGNTVGTVGSVTAAQSGTPPPTYSGLLATAAVNTYVAGPIPALSSAVDGTRRVFTFTALPTNAPTGLNFTGVSATTETLNWTDNSPDESGFVIYRSTDGGVTYNYYTAVAANATSYTATGLVPATNYYWQVSSVREVPSAPITGNQATPPTGNIVSNGTGGGLWSQASTWLGGLIPTSNDDVTIAAGDLVTQDVSTAAAYTLTVNGTLEYDAAIARTLTTGSNVTVSAGGILKTPATGTILTHVLSVGADLVNNGTLNFSTNGNTAGANITFTGAANNTFGGSGATTNIRTITINKGTSNANILELNATSFTVQGVNTDVAGFLTLTAGTFKISGTFTETNRTFLAAAYSVPAATGIWFNNPNYSVSGQNGSPTVGGLLRMTQGTLNIGTATGNSMGFSTGANILVEGGAVNAAGRFGVAAAGNAITYNQSAGTITVCTVGNASTTLGSFDLGTSLASSITMSGGTIVTQLAATTIDYRNQAGSGILGITGGTLQFGNAASGAAKTFNIRGVAPNIVVTNTSAGHTLNYSTTLVNYNNISLNVTTNPGATLNFGNVTFLFDGTTITNNGIIVHNGASSNFVLFNAAAPVSYTGSGTITGSLTNLGIQSAMGFTIDPATSGIPATSVRLFYGNVINSNKLTVGAGGTTAATIQFGNTTTPTAAGTFDLAPGFNAGSGGVVLSYLRTAGARSTGPEVPATRTVNNLTVDENDITHPLTIAGGDLTATGTFTYTNGNIITGSNTLVSGASVAAPGTFTYTNGGIIIGNFKRWITTTGANWNFPVGIVGAKRNASIDFTAAPPTTGGTLTAAWISSPEGTNGLPLTDPLANGGETLTQTSAEGYWSVVAADGLTGGTYTGTFTATGISSADYTRLVLIKRASGGSGNAWTLDGNYVTTTGSAAAPVVSRTGMSGFSEFGLGADAGLVAVNLTYFHGSKLGGANYLDWKINVASDAIAVTLERSADGIIFSPIYNTSATITTAQNPFDYTDVNPLSGKNYYRLKMTEMSGRVSYSNIVVLLNATKGTEIISISPNPVTGGTFSLNATTVKATVMTVIIADMSGKTVSRQTLNLANGFSSSNINVSNLAAGTYRVYGITADGKTEAMGFIKR